MHTAPMPDSAGQLSDYKPVADAKCRNPGCTNSNIRERCWESSCGGYEDYHYRCFTCGKTWWVEGADS